MDIFTILVGVVVISASAFMVAAPLVRNSGESLHYKNAEVNAEVDMVENLEKKKGDTFAILNEIEFDYHTQKLSEEDYHSLKIRYQKQAVAFLKAEEEINGKKLSGTEIRELEQQVEDEIARELEQLLAQKKD